MGFKNSVAAVTEECPPGRCEGPGEVWKQRDGLSQDPQTARFLG